MRRTTRRLREMLKNPRAECLLGSEIEARDHDSCMRTPTCRSSLLLKRTVVLMFATPNNANEYLACREQSLLNRLHDKGVRIQGAVRTTAQLDKQASLMDRAMPILRMKEIRILPSYLAEISILHLLLN